MVALEENQGIATVNRIHHVGTMNVCTQFHVNPFSSYSDISVWVKVVD